MICSTCLGIGGGGRPCANIFIACAEHGSEREPKNVANGKKGYGGEREERSGADKAITGAPALDFPLHRLLHLRESHAVLGEARLCELKELQLLEVG